MQPENETNPRANNPRLERIEQFLLDPDKVIFESLDRFEEATNQLVAILESVNLAELEMLAGENGTTPERGIDYMTDADIAALESFILDNLPVEDVNYPSIPTVQGYIANAQAELEAFLAAEVAKIPRVKGDKGDAGRNGSPDSGLDIVRKIREVNKNQGLRPKDIRGLENALTTLNQHSIEIDGLWAAVNDFKVIFPATPQASSTVAGVTEVAAGTGISVTGTTAEPIVNLDAASIESLALADSALQNITGLITQGTNITITGTGTSGDPYVITAAGGASGGQVDTVVGTADQILVNSTDPVNPVVSLATAITDAVALANTAVQPADLATVATTGSYNDLIDKPTLVDALDDLTDVVLTDVAQYDILQRNGTDWRNVLNPNYKQVYNFTGSTIPQGTVVAITGSSGAVPLITVADKDTDTNVAGITLTAIAASTLGVIQLMGTLRDTWVNTNGLTAGDTLYLGDSGAYTATRPTSGNVIKIAKVGVVAPSSGSLLLEMPAFSTDLIDLGVTASKAEVNILDGLTASTAELNILDGVTASTAEINYLVGVTSGIQSQLNAKATPTGAETFTNKRIQPRTASSTSNANLTPDLASANVYFRTTQTATLAINAPIGTPVIGETILMYISAAGAETINWNATYIPYGEALPVLTVAGKTLMVSAMYNGTNWQTLTAVQV